MLAMTNNTHHSSRFPRPYRAPGFQSAPAEPQTDTAYGPVTVPEEQRYERGVYGWAVGRVRKQSRHWRAR